MPLKHAFSPMTEASLESLIPGEILMTRHLKFVKFIRHDGSPGNLIWCSEVFVQEPEEGIDTEDEILYSVKTLSKVA